MQSARSQRSLIVMFTFMMICFGLLAYRSEVNARHIKDNVYDQCVLRKVNVDRSRKFYMGMVAIEQKNPFVLTSPETVHERIRLYTQAIPLTPECGKKP